MKILKLLAVFVVVILINAGSLYSHCEIPCGIYDDSARIATVREHLTTIEKSMKQIIELSTADQSNFNQIVRWVNNKEEHSNAIQEVATQYFMYQRVKPVGDLDAAHRESYLKKLELLHRISVLAMKTKQSTDLNIIEQLRTSITDFETAYFGK